MPTRSDLAKIHIAKQEMGLADDEYRDILLVRFRKESAAKLTSLQARQLLDYFRQKGWKPRQRQGTRPGMVIPGDGQSRKILALWISLHKAGTVTNRSDRALLSFVKRQTGRQRLEWCTVADKNKVIEALKDWQCRGPRR